MAGRTWARKTPEADLQRACIEWLNLTHDCEVFFVPNETTWKRRDIQKIGGYQPGVADIHIVWKGPEPIDPPCGHTGGMYAAIEFKAPGKLKSTSPEQDRWLERVQRMGHNVAVCDDFERFKELIEQWGVPKRHGKSP